jgi:fatty acid desaturase
MHPDPFPPNTGEFSVAPKRAANAVRAPRRLLLWAAVGFACAALLAIGAWVAMTAGGAAGFLIGLLLGLAALAAAGLASATLTEWRERRA